MVLGKLDSHMQMNETGPLSYIIYKLNSKWVNNLNVRPETINLLEENIGSKLLAISLGDVFLISDTKSKINRTKINKWDYIIIKELLHSKETNRMKWQHTEWERIFANHISDKGLIIKIYK